MTKYQCTTCLGVYFSACEDGLLYFHACGPVLNEKEEPTERPDKRNENIGAKLSGKGVTALT